MKNKQTKKGFIGLNILILAMLVASTLYLKLFEYYVEKKELSQTNVLKEANSFIDVEENNVFEICGDENKDINYTKNFNYNQKIYFNLKCKKEDNNITIDYVLTGCRNKNLTENKKNKKICITKKGSYNII